MGNALHLTLHFHFRPRGLDNLAHDIARATTAQPTVARFRGWERGGRGKQLSTVGETPEGDPYIKQEMHV